MAKVIEMPLQGGGTVFIQVNEGTARAAQSLAPVSRDPAKRTTEGAVRTFESALQDVQKVANSLQETLINLARRPEETSVEFGITFSAEAGMIIASGGVDANIKVALKWGKEG